MSKKRNDTQDLVTKARARQYAKNRSEHVYQASLAIMFRSLIDKHGFNTKDVKTLSYNGAKLAQEIDEGRITTRDIIRSLEEEDDIHFDKFYTDKL